MRNPIDTESSRNEQRKIFTRKLLLIFFSAMLLLTFFSNTINNFTLPMVQVEYPGSGALVKEIPVSGEIIPKNSQSEFTTLNTTVEKVYVKAGEQVKKGQLIMSLDKTEALKIYQEEVINLEKLKLNMETINPDVPGNHILGRKRDETKQKYDTACRNYERIKRLFEAGAESALNYENAETQMTSSAREYDQAREDYEQGVKRAACDIKSQELKVANLKQELASNYDIRAKCDGLLKEVNFTEGSLANSAKPLFIITDQQQGYEFKFTIDSELAAYLTLGDKFTISLRSKRQSLNGTISRIVTGVEGKQDVFLDVKAKELAGGEAGDAFISKEIGFYDCLVSNSAVGNDAGGSFIWLIEERQGAFKNEFYLKKTSVSLIHSDNNKSALQKGSLDQEQRVVSKVEGNRGLSDGCRVLLSD